MTLSVSPIPFFTDNDVPDSVGFALQELGHDVKRLREHMVTNSADHIVATTCREQGLVLITHNVKHFRAISQRYESKSDKQDPLCRILMACSQSCASARIREAIDLIEAEWQRLGDAKIGLHITIGDRWIRTDR